jgi:hypothetical protein
MDLSKNFTYTKLLAASAQATNNTATSGVDTKEYEGACAVIVNIGTKTVGDNDANVSFILQASATNSAAAATNISGATVTTTNNTNAHAVLQLDPRANLRYLFGRWIINAGTNSPSYPVSATLVGCKQVQS